MFKLDQRDNMMIWSAFGLVRGMYGLSPENEALAARFDPEVRHARPVPFTGRDGLTICNALMAYLAFSGLSSNTVCDQNGKDMTTDVQRWTRGLLIRILKDFNAYDPAMLEGMLAKAKQRAQVDLERFVAFVADQQRSAATVRA